MFRSRVKSKARFLGATADVAALLAAAIALFPLYWGVVTSVRQRGAESTALWLPGVTFQPTLAAWERLLTIPDLGASLVNSVIVSAGAATTRALTSTVVPILAALLGPRDMVRALSLGGVKG